MSRQLAQLLFLGRRLTASAIVLLLIACMASGVGAYPVAGGAKAASAAALRPAPLSPPAGNLDPTFGNGGKVTTDFGSGYANDFANAMAIQRDGKIVAAGYTGIYEMYNFALARYQVPSTGSQTIADSASATLEGVTITNHSGAPCDLTVARHPIPPGSAPADLGELPVLWQLATACPSYTFDLVFSYTDTELQFGNNVSEARFQAYRAPDMNGPFSPVDSVVDTDANTVTGTGVTQLSWWGLIDRGPQLYLPLLLHQ